MDRNINERLELALGNVQKPPTLEEVLEQVSRHGVLRGPVDRVFMAWTIYVEHVVKEIMKTFPLSEEEKKQLFHFRDTQKRLLLKAWAQAKEKLATLYKAVAEGTYRLEGNKLYASDGTWIYVNERTAPYIPIHGISAKAYFPDVLKLPRERLELLQLGWRASDEGENGRPLMDTTQPWQVFAWAAARYGEFYIRIASVNLTREGVSVLVRLRANSWKQKWSKAEAIDLVASYLRRGVWAPLLTAWLGDGNVRRRDYKLLISTKEPWRLGISEGAYRALVARGREAFVKLREAAGAYGELLDLLKAHKWIHIKLASDDGFRVAYKQRRSIIVAGVVMYLCLIGVNAGSLYAEYYTRDLEKARTVAKRLKEAGLRPNMMRIGPNYAVYITMNNLLKLAKRDETIRKTIMLYLADKAKNGTPRQRELAKKILKRNPLFQAFLLLMPTSLARSSVSR